MMREDPVLIFMTPRTGSSLVASIFGAHGLWIGSNMRVAWGYRNFENIDIGSRLDAITNRGEDQFAYMKKKIPLSEFRATFDSRVPDDTDWMFKTNIRFWYLMDGMFKAPRVVFVRRNLGSTIQSNIDKSKRRLDASYRQSVRDFVTSRFAFMDSLSRERGIPFVNSDEVVAGDYSSLESAMRACGLELDESKAAACVNRSLWKH